MINPLQLDPQDFRALLRAMGFVPGTGWDSEVWTNPEGPNTQVWVCFGHAPNWEREYDARANSIDFMAFYTWLHERDDDERNCLEHW